MENGGEGMRERRHPWIAIPTVLWLFLSACADPQNSFAPEGATPFTPPAYYPALWQQTESCAGRTADYRAVSWYVVPAGASWSSDYGESLGAWSARGNRITLRADLVDDSLLVRHEMLHAILHDGRHTVEFFFTRCGELVAQPAVQ